MAKRTHIRSYDAVTLAEARLAVTFLGEATAAELYGADLVSFAASTREGRSTAALMAALPPRA